jgi:hypothetical protein
MSKYARFFAILKQINASGAARTKEDIVLEYTGGKTDSLSSLSVNELGNLENMMTAMVRTHAGQRQPTVIQGGSEADKMRKAIISQFKSIGKTTAHAIAWAEKYGTAGVKRKFNEYTTSELIKLIRAAEKMKLDHLNSLAKKLNK